MICNIIYYIYVGFVTRTTHKRGHERASKGICIVMLDYMNSFILSKQRNN